MKRVIIILSLFLFLITPAPAIQSNALSGEQRDSLEQLGGRLYSDGRYKEAAATFFQLDTTSCSAQTYHLLGMSCASLNDIGFAIRFLWKAVDCDPLNAGYRYSYARTLAQSGAALAAQREYQFIVENDPTYLAAYTQLGQTYYDRKSYDSALILFAHVIEENPRDYMTYYLAASALVGEANYDSARTFLAACMALNPHYIPAVVLLASIYYSTGDHREARRLYDLAAQQRPREADYRFKSGLCSEKLDDFQRALSSFKEAVAIDSANDAYYAQLGYVYIQRSQYNSAVAAYRHASALDPENPLHLINLGYSLQKMNAVDKATDAYKSAIAAQHPENIGMVYVRLGTLLYLQKRYRDALAAYTHALEINPTNKEAQFYLALTHDQLSDRESAIRQYQKYLKLAMNDTARQERERKAQARKRINYLKAR